MAFDMAQGLRLASLALATLLGLAHCQASTGGLHDLPSYTTHINATRNDRSPVVLHIDTQNVSQRNQTAPHLYGMMHEDINHSGDGGIYAELLRNRALQGSDWNIETIPDFIGTYIAPSENPVEPAAPVLTAWAPFDNATRMTMDRMHPLSSAIQNGIEIDFPIDAAGEVGFQNFGWWGIDVHPQQYNVSFYVQGNYPRNLQNTTSFTVSLRSNETGEVFASSQITDVSVPVIDYMQVSTTLHPNATAPNSNNTFVISFDGDAVKGQTYYFSLFSLMPETFKDTPNGLRKDIAEALYDLQPKFLRFPGGNNLEGLSVQQRWKWKETLGTLINRPGRAGNWNYYNTQGLGLIEYLEWTEDMQMEPVLAVYSGFSLDQYGNAGPSYPPDRMEELLHDALEEIEFCMGNVTSTWGSVRAALGHPEPFNLKFVEIGNEDWFSSTYTYRWEYMYNGLKAVHPNITYISTAYNEASETFGYNITIPPGAMWDTHHYEEPSFFVEGFDFYDNWQERTNNTGVTVFLGEYAATTIDTPSGFVNFSYPADIHIFYPRLVTALAEGVYLLGMERNPIVCKLAAYSELLENVDADTEENLYWDLWTPDLISFDSNQRNTVRSASYWQQWLFAHYRGTQTLPVTNSEGDFNPLFWGATIDEDKQAIYLKVINTLGDSVPLTVNIPQPYRCVNGTILTAPDLNSYNYINNMTEVMPKTLDIPTSPSAYGENGGFTWTVPRWSSTVLQFNL